MKQPALDRFGYPAWWSVQIRREMRRVTHALQALSEHDRTQLSAARRAVDDAVRAGASVLPAKVRSPSRRRFVLVLPFPIQTGGMRAQLQIAKMLTDEGAETHVRQVRGDDCLGSGYDDQGFASREAVGDPRHVPGALRQLAPATVLVGCWIDYFAALESGAGPVLGYSAGEPTLTETTQFDHDFLRFAFAVHRLPVALLAGSDFVRGIYEKRYRRAAGSISVPISREMFDRAPDPTVPATPFRIAVVGPENVPDKGIPGALRALSPLHQEGYRTVWVAPRRPPDEFSNLVDELHVGLDAARLASVIASCHGLVFPSRLEGLGNPPLEAMALGVPSVLCPNLGSAEYALPGRNCLQVPYGDAECLRSAVRKLRNEPALVATIRRAGYRTAEHYRPARVQRVVRDVLLRRLADLPSVALGGAD